MGRESSGKLAKLSMPRLHDPLDRERLYRVLDQRDRHPIAWISGPPGAGKTTLIARYLETRRVRAHWYQVDGGDADPAALFLYLGELALTFNAKRRRTPLPFFTQEYREDLPNFARRFFREFFSRLRGNDVLVFDNCHECAGTAFDDVLRELCAERPAGIGVVAVSRMPVPPTLARLQSAGTLLELGWDQLRLTAQEAERLVIATGADEADASRLHCAADGWAAGLMMLIATPGRRAVPDPVMDLSSKESVFNYFAGEVFDRAPSHTRELLMRTSLLPEVTPEMAAAVSGNPEAGRILDGLYRRHYFTSRKGEPQLTYQYHDLFREFLMRRLELEFDAEALRGAYRDAAQVLDRTGRSDSAGELLVRSGQWTDLAALLDRVGDRMLAQGLSQTVLSWLSTLEELPDVTDPRLLYWRGTATVSTAPEKAVPWLLRAVAEFERSGDLHGKLRAVCGLCEAIFYRYTDFQDLDPWLPTLQQLVGATDGALEPPLEARALVALLQIAYLRSPAQVTRTRTVDRAIERLRGGLPEELTIELGTRLMVIFANQGDFDLASVIVEVVAPLVHRPSTPPLRVAWWERSVAMMHGTRGDFHEALDHADRAIAIARGERFRAVLVLSSAIKIYVMSWLGESIEAMRVTLDELESACDDRSPMLQASRAVARIVVSQMDQDPKALLTFARDGITAAEAAGSLAWMTFMRLWRALALSENSRDTEALNLCRQEGKHLPESGQWRMGSWQGLIEARILLRLHREDEAAQVLANALRIVATSGALGKLIWSGPDLPWLMGFALERGIEVPTANRVIRHFDLPGPLGVIDWPWPVRVRALGALQLDVGAAEGKPSHKKPPHRLLDLLKALVSLGPEVTAPRVAEALWPDADGDQANGNLSASVHRLRKLLGRDDAILHRDGRLTLNPHVCWIDAIAFEQLTAPITDADAVIETDNLAKTERAFFLYQGHLFTGESHSWMTTPREKLRSRFLRVAFALGTTYEAGGQSDKALAIYERVVELEPSSEPAYRRLMRCLGRSGKAAEARDVYQRCRRVLSSTLSTSPSAETVAVFEALES